MAGESFRGVSTGLGQGVVHKDGCSCGNDVRGLSAPLCAIRGSAGVASVSVSGGVGSMAHTRPPPASHHVSSPHLVNRDAWLSVGNQESSKRKRCGSDGVSWTTMFKKKRVLDVPANRCEGSVSAAVNLENVDCAHSDVVASTAAGAEALVVVGSGEGAQTGRPQIMSAIPGQYAGPLLLDFGEGKVKGLSESSDAYRIDLYDGIEHTVPVQSCLNGGTQRERASVKRPLQVDAYCPVCKRRRIECTQHLGVGGDGGGGTFSQATSSLGAGSVMLNVPLQGTPRCNLDPTSSSALQGHVQDVEAPAAGVAPIESMSGQSVLQSRVHGQQVPAIVEGSYPMP